MESSPSLHHNGFSVKPLKCEWAVQETNFLGYGMMPTGLKPWTKYIEPILALASPKIHKQLHSFIGRVIFYRTMLYHRAHVMATLTKLTKVEHSKFKQN
jgi:hypothetical protein